MKPDGCSRNERCRWGEGNLYGGLATLARTEGGTVVGVVLAGLTMITAAL